MHIPGRGTPCAIVCLTACLCATLLFPLPVLGASFAVPAPLKFRNAQETPKDVMDQFLVIQYRQDGMVDDAGHWSQFAMPEKTFATPGLNCSGLLLEGARLLLERNISFKEAIKDRLGDSGKSAPLGEDWDFGWDLVMNISEEYKRTLILPNGDETNFGTLSGMDRLGWRTAGAALDDLWRVFQQRTTPEKLYLLTFSRLPTVDEALKVLEFRSKNSNRETAFQDVLWALLNSKTFLFNY